MEHRAEAAIHCGGYLRGSGSIVVEVGLDSVVCSVKFRKGRAAVVSRDGGGDGDNDDGDGSSGDSDGGGDAPCEGIPGNQTAPYTGDPYPRRR